MHSEQEDNDQSDAEQHSGSECGHREEEEEEEGGRRSDAGSPMSGAASPPSGRVSALSAHSERRYVLPGRLLQVGTLRWCEVVNGDAVY